jgi:formylglycine-generating enzyme required for sulfatase activity
MRWRILSRSALLTSFAAAALAVACAQIWGIQDVPPGVLPDDAAGRDAGDAAPDVRDGAPQADATPDAPLDAPLADSSPDAPPDASAPCPGDGGPIAVRIGNICIDSTEVTKGQYQAFLDAGVDADQPPSCAWNTSFTPLMDWPISPGHDDEPVAYIDWCDAYAFCKWAGKHLCGYVGGGPVNIQDFVNPSIDAWYQACSKDGAQDYPYGTTYEAGACNDRDAGLSPVHLVQVHSKMFPACEGAYSGIFDMCGNVAEWEDSCDGTDGGSDNCQIRGGGFQDMATSCAHSGLQRRDAQNWPDIGIRCCSQ